MTSRPDVLLGLLLLDPHVLWLAALVPLVALVRARAGGPGVLFGPAALVHGGGGRAPLPRTARVRLLAVPHVLAAAGAVALLVAAARPVERELVPATREGLDVLLCVDVSSSMAERDLDGTSSRLALAKEAAARFVAGRPDDRIGLVAFARYPEVACPPTSDHEALLALLREIELVERDGPEDATGIGAAVARAAVLLGEGPSGGERVVVLLTDGEENVATEQTPHEIAPRHAGQLCREHGVRVHVIAAGAPGGQRAGAPAGTAPAQQVQELAAATGGTFFAARDAGALLAVYASIDALEAGLVQEPQVRWRERFAPFVLAGLLLLLLARVLGATVLGALP